MRRTGKISIKYLETLQKSFLRETITDTRNRQMFVKSKQKQFKESNMSWLNIDENCLESLTLYVSN